MYDQGRWATLTSAIRSAKAGDGAPMLELANTYTDRLPGGGYADNMQEAFYAITCLDKGESPSLADREAQAARAAAVAPTFGAVLVWSSLPCGYWPRPASAPTGPPQKITAKGAAPIVVVGTTRDPATPYEWAQRMAAQLDSGVLVTYDGDGHTAYMRSNACIDDAVDGYFLKGTVPKDGLRC
jgi:pimeloyl-ACP methyl ester carboxylesterase